MPLALANAGFYYSNHFIMCQRVLASSIVIRVKIRVKNKKSRAVFWWNIARLLCLKNHFKRKLLQNKYAQKHLKAQIIGYR